MNFTINTANIETWLAIIVALGAIYGYWQLRRTYNMADGKQAARMEALVVEVEAQKKEIDAMQEKLHCNDVDLAKINTKLDNIFEAINELKAAVKGDRQ